MPVTIEPISRDGVAQLGRIRERSLPRDSIHDRGTRIDIGLVNNMPDAALLATERQFSRLLAAASENVDIRLHLFALRDVPRSKEARATLTLTYQDVCELSVKHLDALIVTGAEPLASDLTQEPYWRALTDLIDWANSNTTSTILSCLAAHAGALYLDGIVRQPLPTKCSGVFAFDAAAKEKLVSGLRAKMVTPHSRRNGLKPQDLVRRHYQLLTHNPEVGVDVFIKQEQSLFVFLQGHPEYEDDSLAREYRRDMNRFLRGEQEALPAIPVDYFPEQVERALAVFAERARLERRPEFMTGFPSNGAFGSGNAPWRQSAIRLYRNWLEIIAERKAALLEEAPIAVARWGG
jgi:homoserine O-succinyltransferase